MSRHAMSQGEREEQRRKLRRRLKVRRTLGKLSNERFRVIAEHAHTAGEMEREEIEKEARRRARLAD